MHTDIRWYIHYYVQMCFYMHKYIHLYMYSHVHRYRDKYSTHAHCNPLCFHKNMQYIVGTRARDLYKKQPSNKMCMSNFCLPSGIIGSVKHDNQILRTYTQHEDFTSILPLLTSLLVEYNVCIYVYIYMCTYIHTYIHSHILIYTFTFICI